jgi:hypothetical protein
VQQAADVIDVVANAKGVLNVLGHARAGPQISWESNCPRALEQMLFQPLALSRGELARPAAGGHRLQRRSAAEKQIMLPSPYAPRIEIHGPGHFGLSKSFFQQCDGMLPLALQLFRTAVRSDNSPPSDKDSIGHYF